MEVFGRIGSCGRHVCQRLRAGPKRLALTVRLRASARAKRPRLSPSMQEQAVLCTAYVHTAWPIVRCRNVSVFAIDASARMVVSAMFCRTWLYALYLGRSLRPGFAVLRSETSAFAGDLLAHHSLMVHWAPANETLQRRRALGFVYIKASVVPDYERFEEFQRQLATVNSPSAKTA